MSINDELAKELAEIEGMVAEAKKHDEYTEKYFIIREGMVKLAGGFPQAALLTSMLSWTRHWLKTDNEKYKEIQQAAQNNDIKTVRRLKEQIRQGWFWKAYREMSKELFGEVSPKTCERYVNQFIEKGLIEIRHAEEKAVYRANWYRANIEAIKDQLAEMGYQLDHFKDLKNSTRQNDESLSNGIPNDNRQETAYLRTRQNDEPPRQNDESSRQNDEHLLNTSFSISSFTNKESMYVSSDQSKSEITILEEYKENYQLSEYARKKIEQFIGDHGEIFVREALFFTYKKGPDNPISYLEGILNNWKEANLQTLEDIRKYVKQHNESLKKQNTPSKKQPKRNSSNLPEAVRNQLEGKASSDDLTEEEFEKMKAQLSAKMKKMDQNFAERKQQLAASK